MSFWSDGPAIFGWPGPLTPEERRKMQRKDRLGMLGCGLVVAVVLAVFVVGVWTIASWALAWPILDRMADATHRMARARRTPKAFYLCPADWDEFRRWSPRSNDCGRALFDWGNNPVQRREEPTFQGIPVRLSIPSFKHPDGRSRIYSTVGNGTELPK